MRTVPTADSHQDLGAEALLHVAGVDTPIHARVTRQSERGMTVEQALPFLQLHTQVWDASRPPSRIESVSVVVYDGTPRLVLDLAFDSEEEAADSAAISGAVSSAMSSAHASSNPPPLPRRAHAGVMRPRVRVDHTQPFDRNEAALQMLSAAPGSEAHASAASHPEQAEVSREPSREPTQLFLTQLTPEERLKETEAVQRAKAMGLALNSMEEELLTPKDFVYHTKLAWLRAQPHLLRAREQGLLWSRTAYVKARPVLMRAARATAALLVATGRKLATQARARMRSRAVSQ